MMRSFIRVATVTTILSSLIFAARCGVAVGRETSVVFDEGKVYLEKLPYALDLTRIVLYGGNGFFATGKNEAFGGWELLYHP